MAVFTTDQLFFLEYTFWVLPNTLFIYYDSITFSPSLLKIYIIYIAFAINDIISAAGTNKSCANIVPTIRPPTIKIIHLSNCNSLHSPLITSSVSIEIYGSIKININIVANPFITDASVLQVVLNSGFKLLHQLFLQNRQVWQS